MCLCLHAGLIWKRDEGDVSILLIILLFWEFSSFIKEESSKFLLN